MRPLYANLANGKEECLSYLDHITRSWQWILRGVSNDHGIVDEATVKHLEGLAPARSREDHLLVRHLMESKKLFPLLSSNAERDTVLENLLSIAGIVPSLFTFFENLKLLEPCAQVMRALLPFGQRKTIRQGLEGAWFSSDRVRVDYSASNIQEHVKTTQDVERAVGYRQLWLFALRNFTGMSNVTTRKTAAGDKPVATAPSPILWQKFGQLALAFGFRTQAARDYSQQDANTMMASQILRACGIDDEISDELTPSVSRILDSAAHRDDLVESPSFTAEVWLPRERRCGRPFEDDHRCDKRGLFLPTIHRAVGEMGANVTPLFCKRDALRAFFGIHDVSPTRRGPASLTWLPE